MALEEDDVTSATSRNDAKETAPSLVKLKSNVITVPLDEDNYIL